MKSNIITADESIKNYQDNIAIRNKIAKQILQKNEEIDVFQTFVDRKENIDPYSKEHLFNFSMDQIKELMEGIKKNEIDALIDIDAQKSTYEALKGLLGNRTTVDKPELKGFLKKHNTQQESFLKRLFNIPKDPMYITRSDAKRLLPILNNDHTILMGSMKSKLLGTKKELEILKKTLGYLKTMDSLNKSKSRYLDTKHKIHEFHAPFLKILENILDLDFKRLKQTMEENNINIKSILLVLAELIMGKVTDIVLDTKSISKQDLIKLDEKVKLIDRQMDQEKLQKEVIKQYPQAHCFKHNGNNAYIIFSEKDITKAKRLSTAPFEGKTATSPEQAWKEAYNNITKLALAKTKGLSI